MIWRCAISFFCGYPQIFARVIALNDLENSSKEGKGEGGGETYVLVY